MTCVVELLIQYVWKTHLMYQWFEETYNGNTILATGMQIFISHGGRLTEKTPMISRYFKTSSNYLFCFHCFDWEMPKTHTGSLRRFSVDTHTKSTKEAVSNPHRFLKIQVSPTQSYSHFTLCWQLWRDGWQRLHPSCGCRLARCEALCTCQRRVEKHWNPSPLLTVEVCCLTAKPLQCSLC